MSIQPEKSELESTVEAMKLSSPNAVMKTLEENRTGIVLTGKIKNGKLELDPSCLEQISRKFPNASTSFVAVNAPFDPEPLAAV